MEKVNRGELGDEVGMAKTVLGWVEMKVDAAMDKQDEIVEWINKHDKLGD